MSLKVKLPDGSVREYKNRVRSLDVVQEIGPGLAKAAIAAEVNGETVDLATLLPTEGEIALRILTKKDPQSLAIMRHSCAHVMAQAVMR
ncbi:MAG TPA: TGS domain-containing protein, partial [Pirellulales bacterium]|nr:TGS domain-containing protein [Pirellulales bacterium]